MAMAWRFTVSMVTLFLSSHMTTCLHDNKEQIFAQIIENYDENSNNVRTFCAGGACPGRESGEGGRGTTGKEKRVGEPMVVAVKGARGGEWKGRVGKRAPNAPKHEALRQNLRTMEDRHRMEERLESWPPNKPKGAIYLTVKAARSDLFNGQYLSLSIVIVPVLFVYISRKDSIITARKRSYWKVMFSQVSVILFGGGLHMGPGTYPLPFCY